MGYLGAHINCCNSLAREGPGGSVALTQCVRCSVHSAQCTFRGSKGRGGWWEKYTAEQRRHFCCSTKLGKAEHYWLEALKVRREGEKSQGEGKQLAGNTGAAAANARASPATSSAATATATATATTASTSTVSFFAALPRLSHVSAQLYNMAQSSLTIKCNFALGPVWLIQFFLFDWYNFSDILQFGHRTFGLLHFMNSFILEQHYSISRSLRPCQWTNWSCKWMVSCFLLSSSLPASSSSSLSSR